jgi:hypothetical protein
MRLWVATANDYSTHLATTALGKRKTVWDLVFVSHKNLFAVAAGCLIAAPLCDSAAALDRIAGQTPTFVANNAGLKALNGPAPSVVYRTGFTSADDGGGAPYNWSPLSCPAPDEGVQVQPTNGTGCWIADLTGMRPTPLIWGAKGDSVTDDTAAVQAAITASPVLYTGNKLYRVGPLTAANTISITGTNGPGGVYIFSNCTTGFVAANATENLLTIRGDNVTVEHVCFQMGTSVNQQKAGAAVTISGADSVIIKENQINFPFKGIVIGGATDGVIRVNGHTQTNSTLVYSNVITQPSNGGVGIEIGKLSTGGSTVGTVLRDNSIPCFGTTATGIAHYDSAGTLQTNPNGPYACNIGTSITPGGTDSAHKQFANLTVTSDVLGDSSTTHDLLIDTLTINGVVFYTRFDNSWASGVSATDNSVLIRNTGRGEIKDITFNDFISHSGGGQIVPIMDIEAGINITVSNSELCADGGSTVSGPAIKVGASVRYINILGNKIGSCFGTLTEGVQIVSGANILNIQSNNFETTTKPIIFTPNNETAIIKGNMGVDNTTPTIASSSSITLPIAPQVYITGTMAISNINGAWSRRQETIFPLSSALPFTTDGNICNALVATRNVPVLAVWDAGFTCWRVK